MEHLYSHEFLEQFKSGKKKFTDLHLHFCNLDGMNLTGMVIKDSKLEYTAFWNSVLKDVKFINCRMFFVSFYTAALENVIFDRCKIEMTRFDSARLKEIKISNSSLSYCSLFGSNIGEVEFANTSRFKVMTDAAAVTDQDIADALRIIGGRAEELPMEIKSEIQRRIKSSLVDLNRDPKLAALPQKNGAYASGEISNRPSNLYRMMNKFTDDIIKYGSSEIYKSKKKDIYK